MAGDVVPFELGRMILGDAPPLFLAEILLRVVVIYLFTLLLLRWIGGRSVAQMSIVEFLLVVALGSAVGDGMFYPDVPLLHALLVVFVVVCLSKGLDHLTLRFRRAKRALDGEPVQVVREGALVVAGLQARDMGPPELAAFLRLQGVRNLAEVRAAYLEPMGQLSVFCHKGAVAEHGLRIEPPPEILPLRPARPDAPICCAYCGRLAPQPAPRCSACGRCDWVEAEASPGAG